MLKINRLRALLLLPCVLGTLLSLFITNAKLAEQQQARPYDTGLFKALKWRSVGPYRGGRSAAVTGVASQPYVFYFGATGGGVWKTTDGGANWEVISDNSVFGTGSVGAIGLSDADPNTIYVGMGES